MENEWPDKIDGPTVWDGAELTPQTEKWIYHFTENDIRECDEAISHFNTLNKSLIDLVDKDFPLPTLSQVLLKYKEQLVNGLGFCLFRGFPIQNYDIEKQATFFLGIGSYLGDKRRVQNTKGHILGHVKDLSYGSGDNKYDPEDPTTRIYATRKAQPFHVDHSDIVGLLCLQVSQEGGDSSLMSSHQLYNRLKQLRPDIIELFKAPWHFDKKGQEEGSDDKRPYSLIPPMIYHKNRLFTIYTPHYWETVPRLGIEVSEAKFEAIKFVQELCEKECLKMWLERGDIQFVNNHHLVHARGEYTNSEEKTRHLLRLWLDVTLSNGGIEKPDYEDSAYANALPSLTFQPE